MGRATQLPLIPIPRTCVECGEDKPPGDFVTVGQKTGRCVACRGKRKRERQNECNKGNGALIKLQAIDAYGNGRCAYCGEADFRKLQIDHIDGNGKAHRQWMKQNGMAVGAGPQLYYWLRRNGYPQGFQVLCEQCNWAKGARSDTEFRQWLRDMAIRLGVF